MGFSEALKHASEFTKDVEALGFQVDEFRIDGKKKRILIQITQSGQVGIKPRKQKRNKVTKKVKKPKKKAGKAVRKTKRKYKKKDAVDKLLGDEPEETDETTEENETSEVSPEEARFRMVENQRYRKVLLSIHEGNEWQLDIAKGANMQPSSCANYLNALIKKGFVERIQRGQYKITEPAGLEAVARAKAYEGKA